MDLVLVQLRVIVVSIGSKEQLQYKEAQRRKRIKIDRKAG